MSERDWVKEEIAAVGGQCVGGLCRGGVRCSRHAARWARVTMEKRGWVCIDEYGTEASKMADKTFLTILGAVTSAGVDVQKWLSGWDDKRGVQMMGLWAPKAVAAIIGCTMGKLEVAPLAQAFKQAKLNPAFASAVEAAWRLSGPDAAIAIIGEYLPHVAAEINRSATK